MGAGDCSGSGVEAAAAALLDWAATDSEAFEAAAFDSERAMAVELKRRRLDLNSRQQGQTSILVDTTIPACAYGTSVG